MLCSLRDAASDILDLGTRTIAVSTDEPDAVRAFARELQLPYPVLADPDQRVSELYGVVRDGRARRVSFLLDEQGIVRHVDEAVPVSRHGADVVENLRQLQR